MVEAYPGVIGKSANNVFQHMEQGRDPYRAMASERFGKPYEDVTHEERYEAKKRFMHALYSNNFLGGFKIARPAYLLRYVEGATGQESDRFVEGLEETPQ